jgi:hypothetical protein
VRLLPVRELLRLLRLLLDQHAVLWHLSLTVGPLHPAELSGREPGLWTYPSPAP